MAARAFQRNFPAHGGVALPKADDIDTTLHAERLDGRRKRLHVLTSPAAGLPDGAMILQDGVPHLVLVGLARPWSLRGYGAAAVPLDSAQLITQPSTVAVLRAGYRPQMDASVFSERNGTAVQVDHLRGSYRIGRIWRDPTDPERAERHRTRRSARC
jgi:hypothetical protein